MNKERLEELAALHALHLLNEAEERELLEAIRLDPQIRDLVQEFAENAALLAHDVPEVPPPPQLKDNLLRLLPSKAASSRIIHFPAWIPYAIAACLMALGIVQTLMIVNLKSQMNTLRAALEAKNNEADQLRQSNALKDLRLATLQEATAAQSNTAYASARIVVAWDPRHNQGIVSMHDLPVPPAGHDYQLWVLDPKTSAPISAGLITGSRPFAVNSVGTPAPGFAISLEPSGGRPTPTGPILFAIGPGQ